MSLYFELKVYSHFFKLANVRPDVVATIRDFGRRQIQYETTRNHGKWTKEPIRIFATRKNNNTEFRFIKALLPDFLEFIKVNGIKEHHYSHEVVPLYKPNPFSCKLPNTWIPREKQVPLIDYILEDGEIKTINLQAGQGKTSLSLKAAELHGKTLMVIVLGRYFEKWKGDLQENYGLEDGKDLISVRGFKALQKAMKEKHNGEHKGVQAYLITTGTFVDYFKQYESDFFNELPEWYPPPDELYTRWGIGFRIIDEVHEHFHTNYLIDLYTHSPKTTYLSATIEDDDNFINKMLKQAYPESTRMTGGAYIRYCDVKALHYNFNNPRAMRSKGRGGAYSHIVFEKAINSKKQSLENYLEMIYQVVVTDYLERREHKDQKMLIFAANKFFCEKIRNYLRKKIKDKDIIISKYLSEDDYSVLMESHITVSTLGSSGTAVDIPGLITVYMTVALNKLMKNLQALGRLRELFDTKVTPLFIYAVCDDNDKHVQYHHKKRNMIFRNRVLSHRSEYYGKRI